MRQWKVLIAASSGDALHPGVIRQRLLNAWHNSCPATFTITRLDELDVDRVCEADAVVLLDDDSVPPFQVRDLVHRLDDAGLPVLALVESRSNPPGNLVGSGVWIESHTASDDRLCAVLQGMLHRQFEVKRLQAELAMTQRFHGGLKGQIVKMHEEMQLAAMVQRDLLPREIPCLYGVEFGVLWRPSNYVSGDIYDVARLDEDHIGVFIADASGHGVPAALMTMVIRRALILKEISESSYRLVSPAEVLSRLNRELLRHHGGSTKFVTAVYALVDCRSRTLKLARAGHPPPVHLASNGDSTTLQPEGGLLGIFPEESFGECDLTLGAGDHVLFYTDGFEQAFPPAHSTKEQLLLPNRRYRDAFQQLSRLATAEQMVETIGRQLDEQTGSLHQNDDLTLICLHAGQQAIGHSPKRPGMAVQLAGVELDSTGQPWPHQAA